MNNNYKYIEKIKTFNEDQISAANCFQGPLLVLAGPGSGKSTVLKVRASLMVMGQNIIKNKDNKNILVDSKNKINPENILMVTFTNKAAAELEQDMKEYLDDELGSQINVGTFHSLASRILKENYEEFSIPQRLKIIQGEEQEKIIKLVNNYSTSSASDIISQIGLWKNELKVGREGYMSLYAKYRKDQMRINMIKVYESYELYKQENNLWDTDDLITRAILFLQDENYSHVREKYQKLFKYIMLDEYQDTNASQYKFSMLLKSDDNNICVVGDPDQSIYEWRGADMSIITRFVDDFDNANEVLLLQNYRSQGNIIEVSDFILQNNNTEKKPRGSKEQGHIINRQREAIEHVIVEDEYEEARFVLRKIRSLVNNGIKMKDMAIFGRSIKHVETIEEMINQDNELLEEKVAYNVSTQASFYKNKDVNFVWNLMLLAINPHQSKPILTILKYLKFDSLTRNNLETYAIVNNVSIFSIISNIDKYYNIESDIRHHLLTNVIRELVRYANSEVVTIEKIITKIEFECLRIQEENKELMKYYDFYVNIDNIKLLKNFISKLENLDEGEDLFISKNNIIEKSETIQNYSVHFEIDKDYLNLMTMHASKGLEFEVVFCCGMTEGKFPSQYVTTQKDAEADRRLAFVAYTRSKQKLFLLSTKTVNSFGNKQPVEVSRFVKEIFENQKVKSDDEDYQSVVDNLIQLRDKGEVIKTIEFSSSINNSWQKKLVNGDKITHIKLGEGIVIENLNTHIKVDFCGKHLLVPTNNMNLIKGEINAN